MHKLILKPGKEKSLLRCHPWVFSGAVERVKGDPQPGDTVEISSSEGAFLGHGAISPQSQIRARVWSWNEGEMIDRRFFLRRLRSAIEARKCAGLGDGGNNALRLVHGESDGLPGLVVDRYADTLVMQVLACGAEHWREPVADILVELTGCQRIYERSDAEVRELEGLLPRCGVVRGAEPPEAIEIIEGGERPRRFWVDVRHGQKTGFYLDQRDNRSIVENFAADKEVLNCFCYTGGFTVSALAGGAKAVLSVDSSAEALALARRNLQLNGFSGTQAEWIEGDVFKTLRLLRDQGRKFDLIVLDPPKFAPTAALAEKAARAYKDINLLGLKLLRPGGRLATFSCSGGVSADLFQKIVAGAAVDANAQARIEMRLAAAKDHPVLLSFPEGEYLKGLVLRRLPD